MKKRLYINDFGNEMRKSNSSSRNPQQFNLINFSGFLICKRSKCLICRLFSNRNKMF